MKKNKTNRVIILSSIFTIMIVSLIIFVLNYTKDSSSFSIIEKNWINKNKNNVIKIYKPYKMKICDYYLLN